MQNVLQLAGDVHSVTTLKSLKKTSHVGHPSGRTCLTSSNYLQSLIQYCHQEVKGSLPLSSGVSALFRHLSLITPTTFFNSQSSIPQYLRNKAKNLRLTPNINQDEFRVYHWMKFKPYDTSHNIFPFSIFTMKHPSSSIMFCQELFEIK